MMVTTQLLIVFYTFFYNYPTFVLYFILFFFVLLLAVGSLSLFLCPCYWVGLHGSRPFLTPFVFVLFKYTILPCFGQKKKRPAYKLSLSDSISKWTSREKKATSDVIKPWKQIFWDSIYSPKSSLLNSRC